jgi:hypothetical protein
MTDESAETPDPAELFTGAIDRKRQRQAELAEALTGGPPAPEPDNAGLEELADAVADRLLQRLEPEQEVPEPDVITGAAINAEERRAALLAAVTGRRPHSPADDTANTPPRTSGFDGGARPMELPQPEETHDQTVARLVIESRRHRSG